MSEVNQVLQVVSDAEGRKPTGVVALVTESGNAGIEISVDYAGQESSYQPVAVDLNLDDDAGTDASDDTCFLAPVMGNITGDAVAGSGNYLAGVIGAISIATPSSDMPVAGLLGIVMDGSDGADSVVHAHIDGGDPSSKAHANAMFGVSMASDHADSGTNYGLSLKGAANAHISGAVAYVPDIAEVQFSNGAEVYVGTATTRNAVRTQAGTQGAIGSLYLSSAGKAYLKVAVGGADTDWQKVTTTAAD